MFSYLTWKPSTRHSCLCYKNLSFIFSFNLSALILLRSLLSSTPLTPWRGALKLYMYLTNCWVITKLNSLIHHIHIKYPHLHLQDIQMKSFSWPHSTLPCLAPQLQLSSNFRLNSIVNSLSFTHFQLKQYHILVIIPFNSNDSKAIFWP